MRLNRLILSVIGAVCLWAVLCAPALARGSITFTAMDTVMTVSAEGADDALLAACEEEARRVEALLSAIDERSEIYALNRDGAGTLGEDGVTVLRCALDVADMTNGALDVTLRPVVMAWGFTTGAYRVPGDQEIAQLLQLVNWRGVKLDDQGHVTLAEGMMLDLGAVAKGYASDRLADVLRGGGVTSALVNLGGNIGCLGSKADGSAWRIGIRDPLDDSSYIGIVSVRNACVVTSGQYERFFTDDEGHAYGHIFDPATGKPAEGGLSSVTVVGESGMLCDALSTALFAMGLEEARSWLAAHEDVQALLLDDSGELWLTPRFGEGFAAYGRYARAQTHRIGE